MTSNIMHFAGVQNLVSVFCTVIYAPVWSSDIARIKKIVDSEIRTLGCGIEIMSSCFGITHDDCYSKS